MDLRQRYQICLWLFVIVLFANLNFLQAQDGTQTYIIKLRDDSVVRHMELQSPAGRIRERLESPEAFGYRAQLLTRQGTVRRMIEGLPMGRVRAQFSTVFNGFAAVLRPEDVA